MSIQINTKERVAATVAMLAIGGAGLAATSLWDSETTLRTGKPVEHSAPAVVARSGVANGDGVSVAAAFGRSRWGRTVHTGEARRDAGNSIAAALDTAANGVGHAPRSGEPNSAHTVTVRLPSYEPGRPPSATAPRVQPGTPPAVEPGWTTTVGLGTPPQVSGGSVEQGQPGRLHRPTVEVS